MKDSFYIRILNFSSLQRNNIFSNINVFFKTELFIRRATVLVPWLHQIPRSWEGVCICNPFVFIFHGTGSFSTCFRGFQGDPSTYLRPPSFRILLPERSTCLHLTFSSSTSWRRREERRQRQPCRSRVMFSHCEVIFFIPRLRWAQFFFSRWLLPLFAACANQF